METVTFWNVSKRYPDGTCAVNELNLVAEAGEFLVLVGPSGCGKTTALRMVAGLEDISAGQIRIGNTVVNDLASQQRDIAMIFQNYALYPHMSIFENIAFPLRTRKVPPAEVDRKVRSTAHKLGLSELLHRSPKRLSGGQRQRVAMARAIVREPRVFLMDEPLSNLDAKLRAQMRAEISRLQRELGVTTIYVTHDQVEAMTMGTRIAVMRKGVLQQLGTPQCLYDRPDNLFVATFVGSPAMNLFEAEVSESAAGLACRIGDQAFDLPASVLEQYPALRQRVGGAVALGLRPEHLVDPARRPPDAQRIRGRAVVVEALGPEIHVQIEMRGRPIRSDEVKEIARDIDAAVSDRLDAESQSNTVRAIGRFDPQSRSHVRWGDTVEMCVDLDSLQFFDLASGETLRSPDR